MTDNVRSNTNNTMRRFNRKLLAFIIAFATLFTTLVAPVGSSTIVAEAATYKQGNQSLSITDEMAVLSVGSNTYQLSKMHIVEDGGLYNPTHPIAVMLWKGNTLFGYCYDLQGGSRELVLIDNGVLSLLSTGEGENRIITGYVTSAGTKQLPTFEAFKRLVNGSNTNNNNSNNNGNTGNTVTGKPVVSNNTVTYSDGLKTYTLSTGKTVVQAVDNAESTSFVHFADGSLSYWNYSLEKNQQTVTLHKVADKINGLVVDSNGYAVGYYDSKGNLKQLPTYSEISAALSTANVGYSSSLENTTAYLNVLENGYYKKLKVATSPTLCTVGDDNLGSIYLYYGKTLKLWNYQVQKGEASKNLLTVSTNCTGLAYLSSSSNKVAGYYENGTFKPLWTLEQIKSASAIASSYVKYAQFVNIGTTTYIKDSNKKTIHKIQKKNNCVYWDNKKVKTCTKSNKLLSTSLTRSKTPYGIFLCKKGTCYFVNEKGKVKRWRNDVKAFCYDDGGVFQVQLKNGDYKAVPNNLTF